MALANNKTTMTKIIIDIPKQRLTWQAGDSAVHYTISSAKNGVGQQMGSYRTPIGRHVIAEKIGENAAINSVFVARQATGEVYDDTLARQYPNRDWILTRILWLAGCERGVNQGFDEQGINCDSYERYIYIHGTPDSEPMGVPNSHGCIRMTNADMVDLFDKVQVGTCVEIIG